MALTSSPGKTKPYPLYTSAACVGFIIFLVLYYYVTSTIVPSDKKFTNSSDFATKEGILMLVRNDKILYKSDTISSWDTVKIIIFKILVPTIYIPIGVVVLGSFLYTLYEWKTSKNR